jgi:hypothetical protein
MPNAARIRNHVLRRPLDLHRRRCLVRQRALGASLDKPPDLLRGRRVPIENEHGENVARVRGRYQSGNIRVGRQRYRYVEYEFLRFSGPHFMRRADKRADEIHSNSYVSAARRVAGTQRQSRLRRASSRRRGVPLPARRRFPGSSSECGCPGGRSNESCR